MFCFLGYHRLTDFVMRTEAMIEMERDASLPKPTSIFLALNAAVLVSLEATS
jgi:hypothetical protein